MSVDKDSLIETGSAALQGAKKAMQPGIKEAGDRARGLLDQSGQALADAKGNIYVADRGNRRIQVFDGEGKFLRQITIDVPFDYASASPAIGKKPAPDATGAQAPGSPWANASWGLTTLCAV